jgi:dihydroorotase
VFDREKRFIDEHMRRVVERFPTLKVVFEHITSDAAQFVTEAPANVGATITAHHLLYNRNHMLVGHSPALLLPADPQAQHPPGALLDAATSGSPKFFLGTDSARTPSTPRKPPAAAPAATPPTPPSSCMPKRSNSVTRWTSSKASPACTARTSMACRRTPTITLVREEWTAPPACRSAS